MGENVEQGDDGHWGAKEGDEMEADVPPSRVYSEQDLDESELHRIANGLAAVYTAKDPGRESA